jgi:hypothetical protein
VVADRIGLYPAWMTDGAAALPVVEMTSHCPVLADSPILIVPAMAAD